MHSDGEWKERRFFSNPLPPHVCNFPTLSRSRHASGLFPCPGSSLCSATHPAVLLVSWKPLLVLLSLHLFSFRHVRRRHDKAHSCVRLASFTQWICISVSFQSSHSLRSYFLMYCWIIFQCLDAPQFIYSCSESIVVASMLC